MSNKGIPIRATLVGSGPERINKRRSGRCQVASIDGQNLLFDCGRNAIRNLIDEVFNTNLVLK